MQPSLTRPRPQPFQGVLWATTGARPPMALDDIFGELDFEDRVRLLESANPETFQPGSVIIRQGEELKNIFVILDGEVVVEQINPSETETMELAQPVSSRHQSCRSRAAPSLALSTGGSRRVCGGARKGEGVDAKVRHEELAVRRLL